MLRWGTRHRSVLPKHRRTARGIAAACATALALVLTATSALVAAPAATAADTFSVDRLSGTDRYTTAVAASQHAYPDTANTVYLATGMNYADALVAAPAAASEGGPLLLTRSDRLPDAVLAELRRLQPTRVVVVGGTGAVSDHVMQAVEALGPEVDRRGGADRYQTANAVVRGAFTTAERAYVATGLNYADALSASAVAASQDAPVLLVKGTSATLPEGMPELLDSLGVRSTVVAGGPAVVSDSIVARLDAYGPERKFGADRYETNQRLNAALIGTATRAYLATGLDFPDALSGAAAAGALGAPLYLARTNCVAQGIVDDLTASPVTQMFPVGGPGVLTDDAAWLTSCAPKWPFNANFPQSNQSVLQQLASIPVKGRAPKTGYTRDQFGPTWADVDNNDCDTRNDILRRDLRNITLGSVSGCRNYTVMSGILDDPYTGTTIAFQRGVGTSTAVQIDHVVALSDAWQKGAQQMTDRNRTLFANDPLNLLAVDGPTNASKGDGDAATWLPPNKAIRCDYVARQTAVKAKYGLWVTEAEQDAIEAIITTKCPGQKAIAVTPVR